MEGPIARTYPNTHLLLDLLTVILPDSKNYRSHVREYNATPAFASMGVQIKPPPETRPYCFRIHAQIYHIVSPLCASSEHKTGYGQLYIFDSCKATNQRMKNNNEFSQILKKQLDSLVREVNRFALSFIKKHEIIENNPAKSVKMIFMEASSLDLRRYNTPITRTEVAGIFVGDDGEPPAN